jgi:SAM-dependent methyltransferase
VTLRAAWEAEAEDWLRFCGEPDVFAWRFNIPAFLELVPPPRGLTVDVGCGEGRLARVLMSRGHRVMGIDGSSTLVEGAACRRARGGRSGPAAPRRVRRPGRVLHDAAVGR